MSDKDFLTVNEAAAIVGVTRQAVVFRADSGKLRKVVKYGRIVIPAADVEVWRQERIAAAHRMIAGTLK